jgi:hypothetical protein
VVTHHLLGYEIQALPPVHGPFDEAAGQVPIGCERADAAIAHTAAKGRAENSALAGGSVSVDAVEGAVVAAGLVDANELVREKVRLNLLAKHLPELLVAFSSRLAEPLQREPSILQVAAEGWLRHADLVGDGHLFLRL